MSKGRAELLGILERWRHGRLETWGDCLEEGQEGGGWTPTHTRTQLCTHTERERAVGDQGKERDGRVGSGDGVTDRIERRDNLRSAGTPEGNWKGSQRWTGPASTRRRCRRRRRHRDRVRDR